MPKAVGLVSHNYYNRPHVDAPMFGYTAREIAYMRSLPERVLSEFISTLREIHALPVIG